MIDLATVTNIIEEQRLRCHKPHFDESQYDGRVRINDWNNAVDSLAREIVESLIAHDLHVRINKKNSRRKVDKPKYFCDYCGGNDHTDSDHDE